ncbi:hypothetical protein C4J65_28420 [Streptomyces sp. CB09001]|uniref:hypothetical protein n=1 Tax=unclassified Streptomyces TaxID=2593676 RepID=UPI000E20FDD8|nr:hypothetical protein [Streptomyces sp. CB09001]AXL91782.1 hypothetical protein C4J65_28420 [Streptomyces sp. CB09001]
MADAASGLAPPVSRGPGGERIGIESEGATRRGQLAGRTPVVTGGSSGRVVGSNVHVSVYVVGGGGENPT